MMLIKNFFPLKAAVIAMSVALFAIPGVKAMDDDAGAGGGLAFYDPAYGR